MIRARPFVTGGQPPLARLRRAHYDVHDPRQYAIIVMPMPQQYQIAGQAFDAFLEDARDALGLATRNQTYTVVQAVFVTFRRRLEPPDILAFADALPALLRALFVAEWTPSEAKRGFESRAALDAEVKAFRRAHNFAPDHALATVAAVLRRHVDTDLFDKAVAGLPPEAGVFWKVDDGT